MWSFGLCTAAKIFIAVGYPLAYLGIPVICFWMIFKRAGIPARTAILAAIFPLVIVGVAAVFDVPKALVHYVMMLRPGVLICLSVFAALDWPALQESK